ncbi:MAG TPA: hypothetical protein VFH68_20590 [Polyangia bacterium]|jgi:hypothetical protein|nr:hypothetical protein [Polyangia bacterium]
MTKTHRLPRGLWAALLLAGLILTGGATADAKRAKPPKDGTAAPGEDTPAPRGAAPAGVTLNACGCYRSGETCVCTNKKARCECPEDCEPIGCAEKRQKELDREIAAEVKRAQDEEKKRQDAEKEAQKAAEARARKESGDESGEGTSAAGSDKAPDTAGGAIGTEGAPGADAEDKTPPKPAKTPRRGRTKK